MKSLIEKMAPELDCFVSNAGVGESLSPRRPESADQAADIMEINAVAPVFSSYALAYEWIRLGLRNKKLAFVSSLGAGRGLPRSEAYIASKTALVSFCQGFERDLAPHGIGVSVILPGFVDTDMTQELASRPFLMTVEESARIICDGLEEGRFWIAFPRAMTWISKARDRIPYFIFRWVVTQLQKRKVF
jgi:NAD(P)-dependent dehydrogenase (short-subunit alcohol dehydrogenase family)